MTVYCIGQAKNLNKERLQEYGKHAGAALSKHHGELVSRTVNPFALDGTAGDDLIVILSFPSEENAIAWREDPELSTVHDLRNASGDWTLQLLRN